MSSHAGALDAIERILNRGGDPEDVLRAVLAALDERGIAAAIHSGSEEPPAAPAGAIRVPIVYESRQVGWLEVATDDAAFATRVATLISAQAAASERA